MRKNPVRGTHEVSVVDPVRPSIWIACALFAVCLSCKPAWRSVDVHTSGVVVQLPSNPKHYNWPVESVFGAGAVVEFRPAQMDVYLATVVPNPVPPAAIVRTLLLGGDRGSYLVGVATLAGEQGSSPGGAEFLEALARRRAEIGPSSCRKSLLSLERLDTIGPIGVEFKYEMVCTDGLETLVRDRMYLTRGRVLLLSVQGERRSEKKPNVFEEAHSASADYFFDAARVE